MVFMGIISKERLPVLYATIIFFLLTVAVHASGRKLALLSGNRYRRMLAPFIDSWVLFPIFRYFVLKTVISSFNTAALSGWRIKSI
jgi:hypothetical protein